MIQIKFLVIFFSLTTLCFSKPKVITYDLHDHFIGFINKEIGQSKAIGNDDFKAFTNQFSFFPKDKKLFDFRYSPQKKKLIIKAEVDVHNHIRVLMNNAIPKDLLESSYKFDFIKFKDRRLRGLIEQHSTLTDSMLKPFRGSTLFTKTYFGGDPDLMNPRNDPDVFVTNKVDKANCGNVGLYFNLMIKKKYYSGSIHFKTYFKRSNWFLIHVDGDDFYFGKYVVDRVLKQNKKSVFMPLLPTLSKERLFINSNSTQFKVMQETGYGYSFDTPPDVVEQKYFARFISYLVDNRSAERLDLDRLTSSQLRNFKVFDAVKLDIGKIIHDTPEINIGSNFAKGIPDPVYDDHVQHEKAYFTYIKNGKFHIKLKLGKHKDTFDAAFTLDTTQFTMDRLNQTFYLKLLPTGNEKLIRTFGYRNKCLIVAVKIFQ
ncbi:MAG: hypothetical protein MK132_10290 [Lentisphaerales bacterium]|nr:hypothetical protein [Lentisphaerales bacterium]